MGSRCFRSCFSRRCHALQAVVNHLLPNSTIYWWLVYSFVLLTKLLAEAAGRARCAPSLNKIPSSLTPTSEVCQIQAPTPGRDCDVQSDLGVKTKTQLAAEKGVFKLLLTTIVAASAEPELVVIPFDMAFWAFLCRWASSTNGTGQSSDGPA